MFYQVYYLCKSIGVPDGDVRKDFSVKLYICFFEAGDKPAVAQAVFSCRGVKPSYPKASQISFSQPPSNISILTGMKHGLLCDFIALSAAVAKALCRLKYLFVSLSLGTLDSHIPSTFFNFFSSTPLISIALRLALFWLLLFLLFKCLPKPRRRRSFPLPVIFILLATDFLIFIFGIVYCVLI